MPESPRSSDRPAWNPEMLERLDAAERVIALTGAGMSAESGIPTFRDAMTGLWAKYRPEDLATPEAFARNPGRVWDWYEARREGIRATAPHAGHDALAKLEVRWPDLVVVTQNVDGFHQQAGSSDVVELHGNIMRSICSRTGQTIPQRWLDEHPGHPPPSPHHAAGLARPDVVWFGEPLPDGALERALDLAASADVALVIGTSGMVQPAASLPLVAREAGAFVVEINPSRTPLSAQAHGSLGCGARTGLCELLDYITG